MGKELITLKGKNYASVADIAREYNIDYHLLMGRMSAGHSLEKAVSMGVSAIGVTLHGTDYKSLAHLSRELGIRYESLENRLAEGLTLEDAVDNLLNTEPIVFDNVTYPTLTSLCMIYQIDLITFRTRLIRGWSMGDALLTPVKEIKRKNQIPYRGMVFNSKRELAEYYGYTRSFVIVQSGILNLDFIPTIEFLNSFLSHYRGNRPQLINKIPYLIYDNQWFPFMQDFCTYIGIEAQQLKVFRRNNKTTSLHEALVRMSNTFKEGIVDNRTGQLTTIKQLSVTYGMDSRTLKKKGYYTKIDIKAFPNMRFNKDIPFITPELHYKDLIEKRSKQ